jgi:hypothetical protein
MLPLEFGSIVFDRRCNCKKWLLRLVALVTCFADPNLFARGSVDSPEIGIAIRKYYQGMSLRSPSIKIGVISCSAIATLTLMKVHCAW